MEAVQDESSHEKADLASEPPPRPSNKSYRRKYRKIMVKFEDKMRDSNTLFREQQRVFEISRRLSEQNDQLLELLHHLNESPQVPSSQRYDLLPPTAASRQPTHVDRGMAPLHDPTIPRKTLREARQGLRTGRMSLAEYRHMEDSFRTSKDFMPTKSYSSLLEMPYALLDNAKSENDAAESTPDGFLTPREEERYLESLDAYLNGSAPMPRHFGAALTRGGERSVDKDRETALKNPVSVYNWLRKHHPQVFLQDNEAHAEKPSTRPATARASKRASVVKLEPDLYDEDGIALDVRSSSKGKRKRDDDGGYRPKGGNGRPVKRKKDDGSASAKKSKRASISGPG